MSVTFDPRAYEQMSDGALMRIAMDRAELTPEALAALDAQLASRGLKPADVRDFADSYRAEVAADERQRLNKQVNLGYASRRGIGLRYYGKRDLTQMRSRGEPPADAVQRRLEARVEREARNPPKRVQYQTTLWFCLFWVPLVPLGTYIVHRATTSWLGLFDDVRPLRKIPLDWGQVFKTWAVAALVLAAIYFLGPWLLFWWIKR